ncbi:DUF1593 domain-containing protein [Enterococcus pallens]|uniref:Ig-like domain-containing protein n=1 Tax=Enterococcus pallens ATCC BAA-351 TaxID=1158607 RepID=R2T0G8_9ENTE|nr:DUF1593 domain-containing protein [Enterococcus pallens]EOH93764.1 hypothetical protein UAU_02460 [Enterococcus pallens ATCC BAA-351]EOU24604.1 hypothetical protein I588_00591 [Enterococcus pallens ATCC BAA-351]OJG79574.1 hypothetical protein RV10_GL000701 [Enterococcus pallens]
MKALKNKARTIITTDGEVDDMNSFLRYLLYSNEIDTEGIVLTSSVYHYAGDPEKGIEPFRWTGESWMNEFIDQYEKVYSNLCVHAEGYPTPDRLRELHHIGNISYKGEMTQETAGSQFIENYLLQDQDPRPLYIQTWGGTNTTARALKSLEEKYSTTPEWSALKQRIEETVVLYIILDQDETYSDYIAKNWKIKVVNDRFSFWHFAYVWKKVNGNLTTRLSSEWNYDLKTNYGPLLEKYALMGDGNLLEGELPEEQRGSDNYLANNPEYQRYEFISEGDSPSFFYLLNNGLRNDEDPSFGGWGGRFKEKNPYLFTNDALDYNPYTQQFESEYTLTRWLDDIQDDFKARAQWCVAASFEEATHYPVVRLEGSLDREVNPGEKVVIACEAQDPNQRPLYYQWWIYKEASTYTPMDLLEPSYEDIEGFVIGQSAESVTQCHPAIKLEGANTPQVTCYVPEDIKPGQTLHLILEVVNDGEYKLKTYRRIILTTKEG